MLCKIKKVHIRESTKGKTEQSYWWQINPETLELILSLWCQTYECRNIPCQISFSFFWKRINHVNFNLSVDNDMKNLAWINHFKLDQMRLEHLSPSFCFFQVFILILLIFYNSGWYLASCSVPHGSCYVEDYINANFTNPSKFCSNLWFWPFNTTYFYPTWAPCTLSLPGIQDCRIKTCSMHKDFIGL